MQPSSFFRNHLDTTITRQFRRCEDLFGPAKDSGSALATDLHVIPHHLLLSGFVCDGWLPSSDDANHRRTTARDVSAECTQTHAATPETSKSIIPRASPVVRDKSLPIPLFLVLWTKSHPFRKVFSSVAAAFSGWSHDFPADANAGNFQSGLSSGRIQ
jgi:hypothetical protein